MNVEAVGALREQTMVGPTRAAQHGPVQSETDQSQLSTVGMARKSQVGVARRDIGETVRVVEKQQAHVVFSAWMPGQKFVELFGRIFSRVIGPQDLHGAPSGFNHGFFTVSVNGKSLLEHAICLHFRLAA